MEVTAQCRKCFSKVASVGGNKRLEPRYSTTTVTQWQIWGHTSMKYSAVLLTTLRTTFNY